MIFAIFGYVNVFELIIHERNYLGNMKLDYWFPLKQGEIDTCYMSKHPIKLPNAQFVRFFFIST